jgi:hypothetical protein
MNLDETLSPAALGYPVGDAAVIGITLSRSNLETLLSKLDRPESSCTLMRVASEAGSSVSAEVMGTDQPILLIVKAEEDAEHYNARSRQAEVRNTRGAMIEDGATRLGQSIEVPPPASALLNAHVLVHAADGWDSGIVVAGFKASGTWWYDVKLDGLETVIRASSADVKVR